LNSVVLCDAASFLRPQGAMECGSLLPPSKLPKFLFFKLSFESASKLAHSESLILKKYAAPIAASFETLSEAATHMGGRGCKCTQNFAPAVGFVLIGL
jgi:hypothetical protein